MKLDDQRLARRFAELPAEGRRGFLEKLRESGLSFSELPIVPANRGDLIPTSYAQRSLWLTWKLNPTSPAYNMPGMLRFKGALNIQVLLFAIRHLAERHETLRTVFPSDREGEPRQVILPSDCIEIDEVDLRELPESSRGEVLHQQQQDFSQMPFGLEEKPPLRVRLWQLNEEEFVLGVVLHHIACDGVSIRVLIDELFSLYRSAGDPQTKALEPLPVQFADYVIWLRNWFEAGEKAHQLAYWQTRLGREHPVLELPFDRPRGAQQSRREGRQVFHLPAALSDDLRLLARAQGASLFMVMLALFKLLLFRFSGQTDIRVGAPIAGRRRPETRGLIAYLTNILVLRTQIGTSKTFVDLLDAVRDTVLEAHCHADLPFDLLVEALQPERQSGVHPLFQVKCTQQDDVPSAVHLPDLEIQIEGLSTGDVHFDLSLDFVDQPDGIQAVFVYSKDLFEEPTIERFTKAFTTLAAQVVKQPATFLEQLDTGESIGGLQGEAGLFRADNILELWDASVRRSPGVCAVRYGDVVSSYQELDVDAGRLAAELLVKGIGSESRIGLHAERSREFVVGVLAVLKTGAAYVPLDPSLPGERLAGQLADSGAVLLMSREEPQWNPGIPVMSLDPDSYRESTSLPKAVIHPDQAAYVIYTSGSTGAPKGVVVSHGALANYVQAVLKTMALPEDARSLGMVSTVAADLGHTVLFGALCSGRTLHLIPPELTFDPDAFSAYMREHQIDVLKIVPGHLQALLHAGNPADVLPAVCLVLGGEALGWPLLEQISALKPACRVLNHYGPSEATVGVLTQYADDVSPLAATVPIGKPLANSGAYVLGANLNPLPSGVAGELYLGGIQLARAYQSRPGQTAERLIASPFKSGERLYRSGDRVMMLKDGTLVFLGRLDDQVKVRGHRVEPREVARALSEQPGIAEAEVIARENEAGQTRLHGYVVRQNHAIIDMGQLRHALADVLPDYMVPEAIVALDALPRTTNGKLDRKALPVPTVESDGNYQPPQGFVEDVLVSIWAEVLGLERVGRHDNFFALGGDSILTLQIVARARKQGLKVLPKQLMELQTVAALGSVVSPTEMPSSAGHSAEQHGDQTEQHDDKTSSEPFELTPIQRWFFEQNFEELYHWNQSVMLVPTEAPDVLYLRQAVAAVVAHHAALRLRFEARQGIWEQAVAAATDDAAVFECINLGAEQHVSAAVSAAADKAQRNLSLNQPFKVIWMDFGPGKAGRLLLIAHHLVVDGVSWRILLEDIQLAYRQLYNGQSVSLPGEASGLRQWSQALARAAVSDSLKSELPYWQAVVGDNESSLPGRAEGRNRVADTKTIRWSLGEELTEQLLMEVPQAYRTQISDILLTALARTLCTWAGRDSVLVELEGHGREALGEDIDLSRTVGWFTSLFPVRLTQEVELNANIKIVKEQLRNVPNHGVGYGILRYLTEEGAQLGQLAYPQVTFNYLGQFDRSVGTDSLWRLARESAGQQRSPSGHRRTWLDITAAVHRGEFGINWTYSTEIHDEETIPRLVECFGNELRALIEHCTSGITGFTPSDFPLAQVSQEQLDRLPVPGNDLIDLYPLSPMQSGMLFHSAYDVEGTAYVNQLRIDISGLDPERFKAAWQALFERHDTLRTGFLQSEEPLQWVARLVELPFIELDGVEVDRREGQGAEEALDDLARKELCKGFDLAMPPLMRMVLVRMSQDKYHFIWTRHHLLLDGWSTSRLISEVLTHYAGQSLPRQQGRYRDYIAWLQGRDVQTSERYWRSLLQGLEEPTKLSAARGSSPDQHGYLHQNHSLSVEQTAQLSAYARRARVTVNTLVQAAWALLLRCHTGQRVVSFGVTTASRPAELPGVENLLGLFINTIPVVAEPRPQCTVERWLRDLQSQNLESREHEYTPLFDIQRWVGTGGQALFDTIVVFENYPVDNALRQSTGSDLVFEGNRVHEETNYPLTLIIRQGDELAIEFSCQSQSFEKEQVERFALQLQRLLMSLTEAGDKNLANLDLLSEVERKQLQKWGDGQHRYLNTDPIHHLIEQQVQRCPDNTALTFGDERYSYVELNARSNRLAHYLITLGVKPEVKVGIAADRSVEMVVALLAILKTGGAYVPLDPEYPAERLAYVVEDSSIELLLTQQHRVALPTECLKTIIDLDAVDLSGQPDHNPGIEVNGENLAYIIYTSGSTGKPKGAANRHSALYNRLMWMQDTYRLGASDAVLQKTPFSFDVSVWEFFWPLMSGARLVLAGPGEHRDPVRLVALIQKHRITTLHFVPSMLQAFLVHDGIATCTSLRHIVCSGEALPAEAQNDVFKRLPQAKLYNLYGPTEAAIDVTHWTCREDGGNQVPIGRPISGLQTRVLDGELNLVPQAVAGELYLGGAGLARGYLGRAALSAERFVADPFDESGGRLYRTGDWVRWNTEGQLEYLGRVDHQVKVRGFRIELGEIEAQLLAQPEIRETVVIANEDAAGVRLVSYVSTVDGRAIDSAQVRERLHQTLPDYMVPGTIFELNNLPLNANGKVDRKALPEPEFGPTKEYEAPQNGTEETLAQIWAEVLGVERVGRHDNFFELGGHSLLALTLLERMRSHGWSMPVHTLFQNPELKKCAQALLPGNSCREMAVPPNLIPDHCDAIQAEMVTLIDLTQQEIASIAAAVPGGSANIQDIYPLAALQEGILFHHALQQQGDAYMTSRLLSFDSRQRLEQFIVSLNCVIERHDILRTAVLWEGPRVPVQVVYRHAPIQLEWFESDPGYEKEDMAEQLTRHVDPRRRRIDVRRAPMIRAVAAHDAANDRWLLQLPSHHLVVDHTSLEQIIEEIALIQQGREEELPEPVPFRRFVARARLGVSEAEHEAFFRNMLGDVDEPTAPFGLMDAQGDGSDIEEVRLPLEAALAREVRKQAQRFGVSATSVFHLAWALVLGKTTGKDDVVFGTVLFGRMQGDEGAERALGMFINTLPARVPLGQRSVTYCLRHIHEMLAELIHHEHASLALAQRCSGLPGGTPLFSALLNYRYSAQQTPSQAAEVWDGMVSLGGQERTNYPVGLSVDDLSDGFDLVGHVSGSVGAKRLCEYMQSAVVGIVNALADQPSQAMSEIDLLTGDEHRQLTQWGVNNECYRNLEPVHRLIERQVEARPNATALIFSDEQLSYAELNARSNRLAHYLIHLGIKPETLVGIAVERSTEMVVGLLAILKAGGVYVPLDPESPVERLAHMLEDSGIELLLTQHRFVEQLPVDRLRTVIVLDGLKLSDQPDHNPNVEVHEENPAYVIYTSGSTGKPKGAAVRHRSLASCMTWMQDSYALTSDDTVLHKASFGFDVSVWEIFWPLTAGVRLVVANPGDHRDPARIINLIRRHRVTTLNFVPALLQAFLSHKGIEAETHLRYVICGGEAMPAATQVEALRRLKGVSLQNLYGPTETTIHVTRWTCRDDGESQVPIGRPISETKARILDESLNSVPQGVAGELYIGGELLGRGYLHRPALSAERFVADPFDQQGGRLYRTGDRVRWNTEGQLEYLGRVDHQVKVRGFRIELGEIEAQLLSQSGVREAVVMANESAAGTRLVGYVSAVEGRDLDTAQLREKLALTLPDYMVPNAIMVLERLPLNVNGKVDRSVLPTPKFTSVQDYSPPRGEVEETLAHIWSDVLGVERVGRCDNFFELGGHSLLAVKLVARVQALLQTEFSIRNIFTHPTLAGMSSLISESAQMESVSGSLSEIDAFIDDLEAV